MTRKLTLIDIENFVHAMFKPNPLLEQRTASLFNELDKADGVQDEEVSLLNLTEDDIRNAVYGTLTGGVADYAELELLVSKFKQLSSQESAFSRMSNSLFATGLSISSDNFDPSKTIRVPVKVTIYDTPVGPQVLEPPNVTLAWARASIQKPKKENHAIKEVYVGRARPADWPQPGLPGEQPMQPVFPPEKVSTLRSPQWSPKIVPNIPNPEQLPTYESLTPFAVFLGILEFIKDGLLVAGALNPQSFNFEINPLIARVKPMREMTVWVELPRPEQESGEDNTNVPEWRGRYVPGSWKLETEVKEDENKMPVPSRDRPAIVASGDGDDDKVAQPAGGGEAEKTATAPDAPGETPVAGTAPAALPDEIVELSKRAETDKTAFDELVGRAYHNVREAWLALKNLDTEHWVREAAGMLPEEGEIDLLSGGAYSILATLLRMFHDLKALEGLLKLVADNGDKSAMEIIAQHIKDLSASHLPKEELPLILSLDATAIIKAAKSDLYIIGQLRYVAWLGHIKVQDFLRDVDISPHAGEADYIFNQYILSGFNNARALSELIRLAEDGERQAVNMLIKLANERQRNGNMDVHEKLRSLNPVRLEERARAGKKDARLNDALRALAALGYYNPAAKRAAIDIMPDVYTCGVRIGH